MHSWKIMVGCAAVFAGACGIADDEARTGDEPELQQGTNIFTHETNQFEGAFLNGDILVKFSAIGQDDGFVQLVLEIDEHTVTVALDPNTQFTELEGYDAVLTQDQKDTLAMFAEDLGVYFQDTEWLPFHEISVARVSGYLSETPAERAVPSITGFRQVMQGYGNDGRTKLKYDRCYVAKYDKYNSGTRYARNARTGSNWGTSACGAGNYACMGWCGPGCAWYGTGYCLDCLDHDVCSHNLCASGGSGSTHCGDEYDHAYWDFVYGCGGTAKTPNC